MTKIIALAVAVLTAFCLFLAGHRDSQTASSEYAQHITSIVHKIDTLREHITIHDTVEARLKGVAARLVVHDTIRDTLREQALDTLSRALDECDSSKAGRDSIITKLDTVTKIVRDSARASTGSHVEGYGLAALIGLLVGGIAAVFLLH